MGSWGIAVFQCLAYVLGVEIWLLVNLQCGDGDARGKGERLRRAMVLAVVLLRGMQRLALAQIEQRLWLVVDGVGSEDRPRDKVKDGEDAAPPGTE